jgi:hypothetical protein
MSESGTELEEKSLGATFELHDILDESNFDQDETVYFDYDARTGDLDKIWADAPAAPKAALVKCEFERVAEGKFRVTAALEKDFSDPRFSSEWQYLADGTDGTT